MSKIKIINGPNSIELNFAIESEFEQMKKAIKNCLKNEEEYPTIFYEDRSDYVLFSANYLKNSLIVFPKDETN